MRIRFTRRGRRSQLHCVRPDGTVERAELSDPQVIRGLDPQSLQAEVLTRGVQLVLSGACPVLEFEATHQTGG